MGLTTRRRWTLNREAFDALLARLGPDRESAGANFESLRHRLLQLFSYEGCASPDKWADETLDRVAKRLVEGCEIEDVAVFTRGVARLVLREARLAESRERSVVELPAPESNTKETDAACLENCISALPKATRDLIERYYLSASGSKAAARKELAASLDIEMDALRSRALRARRQLEICMQDCRERHRNDVMNAQNSSFRNKVS